MMVALTFSIRRIVLERNRAQSERRLAEQRANDLILIEAQTSLDIDPTRALAWLKKYPSDAPEQQRLHTIAGDAMSRGVARLVLHSTPIVVSAALSPDGREIVAGSDSDAIAAWNTGDGKASAIQFNTTVSHLLYSHDGRMLAATGDDGRLALWNLPAGVRREFLGHHGDINELLFAPDDRSLITRASDDTVCLWSLSQGTCRRLDFAHETRQHVAYRADGTPLVILAHGRLIEVLDARSQARLAHFVAPSDISYLAPTSHGDTILARAGARLYVWRGSKATPRASFPVTKGKIAVRTSEDESRVAVTTYGQSVDLYDLKSGTTQQLEQPHRVQIMSFSSDGSLLAIGMSNGAITVRDCVGGDAQQLLGHGSAISALQFSSEGRQLLSAGAEDRTLRLWSLYRADRVFQASGGALLAATFSPDGTRLAATGVSGIARVWNAASAELLWAPHHEAFVQSTSFSVDSRWVATASWDRTVQWKNFRTDATGILESELRVQRVLWLDNGATLATASIDGSIDRWDVATAVRTPLTKHGGPITRLTSSPDGTTLLSSSEDGTIRVSSIADGRSRIVDRQPASVVAQFLPDGRSIVSAGSDGSVKVWPIATGTPRSLRPSGTTELLKLEVASDGRHIAAAGADGTLYVWGLPSGELRRLQSDMGKITGVAFSPDSRIVAAAGYNHAACVWSLASGDEARLRGHDGPLDAVAYSPDGKWLATTGADSAVRLWATDTLSWIPAEDDRFQSWLGQSTNLVIETKKP